MIRRFAIIISFMALFACTIPAQSMRDLVNNGVDLYKDKKFTDSEINFKKGIEKSPESYEANFNLGDAYYKQQRYDEAVNSFQSALGLASTSEQKGHIYHNIGNSLLKGQKIKESIEAYKKSLRFNPDDADTKYNLSYALQQLKQQQQQNKNNQDNKDQQKQQQQDNKDNNKNQDKNQQQDQKQQPQNQQSQQDNLKQKDQKISKQEAERILQALKNNEQDLQKKLRKQKGIPVKTDKDW